jgi:hypothetical protein
VIDIISESLLIASIWVGLYVRSSSLCTPTGHGALYVSPWNFFLASGYAHVADATSENAKRNLKILVLKGHNVKAKQATRDSDT